MIFMCCWPVDKACVGLRGARPCKLFRRVLKISKMLLGQLGCTWAADHRAAARFTMWLESEMLSERRRHAVYLVLGPVAFHKSGWHDSLFESKSGRAMIRSAVVFRRWISG